jgi:hypothetical protein
MLYLDKFVQPDIWNGKIKFFLFLKKKKRKQDNRLNNWFFSLKLLMFVSQNINLDKRTICR